MISNPKLKIKNLPQKPGVYLFRDAKDQIIYIGKALSLKHRVASYFQNKNHDPKTIELVKNIAEIQTILVNSEFEALLLEAKLIKQHKPKYNIQFKDGKSYLYIVIGKEFPNRIFLARLSQLKQETLDWYGPFPSSSEARQILKFVRRIFPFRSCKKLPKSPCLYYHLKLCPGVCLFSSVILSNPTLAGESRNPCVPKDDRKGSLYPAWDDLYRTNIARIRQILSGKTSSLIKCLEKEMKAFAKENKFEEAQKIKKQIEALTQLTVGWQNVPKEKQNEVKTFQELRKLLTKYQGIDPVVLNRIEGYDVSNLSKDIIVGAMVAFINGEPDKSQYRKFNLKYTSHNNLVSQNDPEGIKQIVLRRLGHPEWLYPQLVLIDGGKTQLSAAFEAIKEKSQENNISLLGITKEEELIIIPKIANRKIVAWKTLRLPRNSSLLQLLQRVRDEAHRFAQKYYHELHLKTFLKQ